MSDDCVKVAVRVRPMVDSEKGCQTCINMVPGEPQIQVSGTQTAFTFDYVFGSDVQQELVYNEAVKHMVTNIFDGYNVTILAYGQTGSGKTYSMGTNYIEGEPMGVIPRAITDIFNTINSKKDWDFRVSVAFIELYQEQLYDLLSEKTRKESVLEIREDPKGIKIAGLTEREVKNVSQTFASLSQGSLGRATGATNMNSQSSRSHAIFTITVRQQKGDDSNSATESKFQLVDLAGSERSKKTGATGDRFKEGVNINKGLLALGNVISLLGEGNGSAYIGYRDSKLTRLLQDSLGGNSKTLMLACVSPADYNLEETLSTLRYADRAKKIKNKPIVNQDPRASEINRLKNLVRDLQLSALGQGSGILSCPPEHGELSEKNRLLQRRLRELTEQLHANLIETMCMHERTELAEDAKNKMEKGLSKILDEFKNCLENEEIGIELRAILRKIYEKILDLQNHQMKTNAEIMQQISTEKLTLFNKSKDESNGVGLADDNDMSVEENIINLDEQQAEHTLQQAERNNEVQSINRALAVKEELVSRLLVNASQTAGSKELQEMENEVKTLQYEKEQLLKLLEESQNNSASAKISETRRKKLQELEKRITELNRKCIEQSRIIKAKEKTDQQVKNLSNEILGLKQTRVKLIREMRKESEKFSQWKLVREREVHRLKDQDRKRQNQMVRLQSLHNKQQNVFKRKMEEASAINKRLKEAFEKQKKAGMNRIEKTKVKESVKSWVNQELEVLLSTVDGKCSLEKLMKDRVFFAEEIKTLKAEQAKNPSDELEIQINDLNTYVDLRSAQISELQNQVAQSDQVNRSHSRLETIQTVSDAKIIIKELFQSITEIQKKLFEKSSDHEELAIKLDAALLSLRKSELKQIVESQAMNSNVDHELLEKEIAELKNKNADLEKELASRPQRKRNTITPKVNDENNKFMEVPVEIFDSDLSFEDDTENDPDWRKTPIAKRLRQMKMNSTLNINHAPISTRLALKRSSEGKTTCICSGPCKSKLCLCRKDYVICSANCGCDPEKCQNKDKENAAQPFFNSDGSKRAKIENAQLI